MEPVQPDATLGQTPDPGQLIVAVQAQHLDHLTDRWSQIPKCRVRFDPGTTSEIRGSTIVVSDAQGLDAALTVIARWRARIVLFDADEPVPLDAAQALVRHAAKGLTVVLTSPSATITAVARRHGIIPIPAKRALHDAPPS